MASKELELKTVRNGQQCEDDEPETSRVVPPDGGYGWVIMIAAFLCNVVVDGIIFSIGLVVEVLAADFNVDLSVATWVGSLLSGFYLLAGPFVSALSNRYGFRTVTILGAVLGSISLAVSIFATSVQFLYVTVGIVGGIGFGLVYVPAVVAVGYYFEKKRALATGIAVCGSGVGTFVIAPFTSFLLDLYGWQGTLLIFSGLILNCAVFGSLFRPLEPVKRRRQRANAQVPETAGTPLMERIKKTRDDNLQSEVAAESGSANVGGRDDDFRSSTKSLTNVKLVGIKAKRSSLSASSDGLQEKKNLLDEEKAVTITKAGSRRSVQGSSRNLNQNPRPMDRADAFFTGSVHDLAEYKQDPANYHASVNRLPAADVDDSCCGCLPEDSRRTLLSMMDFTLFKSPSFVLICISAFLTFMGFFIPFMFLAARAKEGGVDSTSASNLLAVVGVTNTIGRVICGAVADHPKVSVLLLNNIALTLCGVVTLLTPLLPAYEFLMAYAALFGISIAGIVSIRSILLVELLGLEKLTNSFGLMLPFTGLSACIGGPLAGMFYDATQDFNASFYLAGAMFLISGFLCYPLGVVNRWERSRRRGVQPVPEPVPMIVSA